MVEIDISPALAKDLLMYLSLLKNNLNYLMSKNIDSTTMKLSYDFQVKHNNAYYFIQCRVSNMMKRNHISLKKDVFPKSGSGFIFFSSVMIKDRPMKKCISSMYEDLSKYIEELRLIANK